MQVSPNRSPEWRYWYIVLFASHIGRRLKMKPLIHTAAGETALIAFLIHLASWCLAGPASAGGGQDFIRTMAAKSNWSSNATIHPMASLLSALVEGGSRTGDNEAGDNSRALRKRRSVNSLYNGRSPLSTMTMIGVQGSATYAVQSSTSPAAGAAAVPAEPVVKRVSLGLLLPHTTFRVREYSKAVQAAMNSLRKQDLSFINSYRFQVSDIHTDMLKVNPSPTGKEISLNHPTNQRASKFVKPRKEGEAKKIYSIYMGRLIYSVNYEEAECQDPPRSTTYI